MCLPSFKDFYCLLFPKPGVDFSDWDGNVNIVLVILVQMENKQNGEDTYTHNIQQQLYSCKFK